MKRCMKLARTGNRTLTRILDEILTFSNWFDVASQGGNFDDSGREKAKPADLMPKPMAPPIVTLLWLVSIVNPKTVNAASSPKIKKRYFMSVPSAIPEPPIRRRHARCEKPAQVVSLKDFFIVDWFVAIVKRDSDELEHLTPYCFKGYISAEPCMN